MSSFNEVEYEDRSNEFELMSIKLSCSHGITQSV
jgi:hypothetical protein